MSRLPEVARERASESLEHADKDAVGKLARIGAVWSILQIVARNSLSIGTTAILARLLTPDDYGLMGMVATLTVLLLVFSDMGLSWATIQKRELSTFQISNLFWINAVAGAVLWVVCIAASPLVADFYGRQELRPVIVVLGASFLLGGLAVQPLALLARRMQFRVVAEIEVAAVALSAVGAIAAAMAGMGYWALVVQALIGQLVRIVLAFPRSNFVLLRPRRGIGTRQLVGYGGLLAMSGVLIYVARNFDSVLIGKYWGTEQLGYYGRAYFLMLLPSMLATGVLTNLMVPSLSALQDDAARFGAAYRRAVRMVAFAGCPIAVGLALTAPEAVRLMYGERWAAVVPMLVWLSVAGVTQPIYNTTGWLLTAVGKAKLYFMVTVLNATVLAITFLLTVRHGATAVAMGYGLVMGTVLLWPALWFAHRGANLRLRDTASTLWPVVLSVSLMAVTVSVVGLVARSMGFPWQLTLMLKIAVGIAMYALVSLRLLSPMLREDILPMLPRRLSTAASGLIQ